MYMLYGNAKTPTNNVMYNYTLYSYTQSTTCGTKTRCKVD